MEIESAGQEGVGFLSSLASLDFSLDEIQFPLKDWSGQKLSLVVLSCIILAYACYYLGWIASKPKVIGSGQLKERLLKSCPILSECYWPTFWGIQCHVSTIARCLLQKDPQIKYSREILTLTDGGEVALDWGIASKSCPRTLLAEDSTCVPVLLILPGITGSSADNYVQHLVEDGLMEGYRPMVFNQRGNGGVKLKTLRTYSASNISDLFEVVQYVHTRYPEASLVGVGVSLGGMILTQYLHQLGKECDISAVISISPSWDPFVSRKSLEEVKINKLLYSRLMVKNLKAMVLNNLHLLPSEEHEKLSVNMKKIMEAKVVSDIDTLVTVPLFGFACLEDYYKASRNSDKIFKIQRPLVCISSADDPFVPQESLPYEEIEHNPQTVMVITSRGGHFGFIEGVYPTNKTWMDRAVKQFLTAFKEQC